MLLLNGADVNSVDSGQRSALLSACWQGHLVIADILLTAGANVNHQCGQVRGSRVMYSEKAATLPFSLAKSSPSKELSYVTKLLCLQGASPLAVAAQEGHMEVLQLLLQHGADPLLQDHHGRDPHRVALRNNNSAVAELLGGAMKRLSDCRVAAGDMVSVSRASNKGTR